MPGALLIDGNSLLYRAFFALPPLSAPDGTPTNALYGFLGMLLRAIADERPEYIAVAFDLHGPTFRHLRFADYKGTRAPTPDDLRPQFPLAKEVLRAMGIPVLEKETFEADDLLGTVSRIYAEAGIHSLIVTGDRDSFQLTGPQVEVLYTKRGMTDIERITEELIAQRYGLTPAQLIDMKALCGDTSDNIPGIAGIGEKTAMRLVAQYGSLEACLAAADTGEKGKLRERLLSGADTARECYFLAKIDRHAPIEFAPEDARVGRLSGGADVLARLGLKTSVQRLKTVAGFYADSDISTVSDAEEASAIPAPQASSLPADTPLASLDELAQAVSAFPADAPVSIIFLPECVCTAPKGQPGVSLTLGQATLLQPATAQEDVCRALAPLFASPVPKLVFGEKALRTRLAHLGIELVGEVTDLSLAAYVLEPQRKSFAADALLAEEQLPLCASAAFTLQETQSAQVEKDGLAKLLCEIEQPLSQVLYRMEREGFRADETVLEQLGRTYSENLAVLEQEIVSVAGHPINIQSPKQLAAFLFDELGLQSKKRGAQARSTNAEVLEQLDHPVVEKILEYRHYAKLNGTYIEGLLRLLRMPGGDGRIHTVFDQTATATGRLSSLEPNLQNIPVRSAQGRDIRKAFTAKDDCVLVDADYSQIELRVLAHMAHDERMLAAFRAGEDIHRRTAAEIYSVPIESVTAQMRSAAKAVNFGIVYGISDFGLARNTGLSRKEAADFIKMYLTRYPAIGNFMREAVSLARERGYAQTLLGRRRYIPELSSANRNVALFGERVAMNSPIQGTAADIIKAAMIAVDKALSCMRTRLILQVHDELILEAPIEEAEQAAAILQREMENVIALDVPLKADVATGHSWYECK